MRELLRSAIAVAVSLFATTLPETARATSCTSDAQCTLCPGGTNVYQTYPCMLSTCGTTPGKGGSCGAYLCVPHAGCPTKCTSDAMCVPGGWCTPDNRCVTACAADADCAAGKFCNLSTKTCTATKAIGTTCTTSSECGSGHCVEGVCCDTSCTGTCQSCLAANKASGADGACGNVKEGIDPHDQCPTTASTTCGTDGQCDGKGACRLYAAGVACGATTCTGNSVSGKICNGLGTCTNAPATDCSPYLCKGSACANPCAADADCATGYHCDGGTCKLRADKGTNCSKSSDCMSGNCVDGVCCDSPCTGKCQACDVEGSRGNCAFVNGDPHGTRGACGGTGKCAGSCDGSHADCTFPGATTNCGSTCDGLRQTVSACDGTGTCVEGTPTLCPGGYVCGGDKCLVDCTTDAECASGYFCDKNACKPKTAAKCDDASHSTSNTGTSDCAPYVCDQASGACKGKCEATTDCLAGFVCDTTQRCTPAPAGTDDSGGCTFHPVTRNLGLAGLAMLAACAAVARRRSPR